mmetsp:Transcript_51312/g.123489  ORF Transcript_51312/g.123489 Transcript_51312/m.123489 type:complete len:205 (+) Transcript_51312:211-825(+)
MAADEEKEEMPLTVTYCEVCGLPPEYCSFGPNFERCKPWLRVHAPELYPELVGDGDDEADAAAEALAKASLESAGGGAGGGAGGSAAAGGGGGKKGGKRKKKGGDSEPKVVISRKERNKRKFVTIVTGLDGFPTIKMKQAAKTMGKKFSCGSSVQSTATGGKQIDIQGDVQYDVPAMLVGLGVPADRIFLQEGSRVVRAEVEEE